MPRRFGGGGDSSPDIDRDDNEKSAKKSGKDKSDKKGGGGNGIDISRDDNDESDESSDEDNKSSKDKSKKSAKSNKKGSKDSDDGDAFISRDEPLNRTIPEWILRPCDFLIEQFNETVNCSFTFLDTLLSDGQVTYSVETVDRFCDDGEGTEQVCFQPKYSGLIDFDDLYTSASSELLDVTVGGAPFGDVIIKASVCLGDDDAPNNRELEAGAANAFQVQNAKRAKRKKPRGSKGQGKIAPPSPPEVTTETENAFRNTTLGAFLPSICSCEVDVFGLECTCSPCEDGIGVVLDCGVFGEIPACFTPDIIRSVVGNGDIIQPSVPDFLYDLGFIPTR